MARNRNSKTSRQQARRRRFYIAVPHLSVHARAQYLDVSEDNLEPSSTALSAFNSDPLQDYRDIIRIPQTAAERLGLMEASTWATRVGLHTHDSPVIHGVLEAI